MSPRVRAPDGGTLQKGRRLPGLFCDCALLFSQGVAGQSGSAKGRSTQKVVFFPERMLAFSDLHFK